MELDLDESSLAIGHIERALSRIEKALADRATRPAPVSAAPAADRSALKAEVAAVIGELDLLIARSEEHTSELQSLMRISYAVFCLKKKNNTWNRTNKTVTYNY